MAGIGWKAVVFPLPSSRMGGFLALIERTLRLDRRISRAAGAARVPAGQKISLTAPGRRRASLQNP